MTVTGAEFLLPLAVGAATTLVTLVIHGFSGRTMGVLVARAFSQGRVGVRFRTDGVMIAVAAMLMLTAHLVEVTVWAVVMLLCGEFRAFAPAFYSSASNYTTLGYTDVVMSVRWRLMGPLEALDGMLLLGITTALLFSIIQRVGRIARPELFDVST